MSRRRCNLILLCQFATVLPCRCGGGRVECCRLLVIRNSRSCRGAGYESESQARSWMKPCQGRQVTETVESLDLLVQGGSHHQKSALYGLLKRCMALKDLVLGTRVHALVLKHGYESNAFLANHIICMYASHERLKEAMEVFTKVPAPCRYMWASILLAHVRHGQPKQAIRLYGQLRQSALKPDNHIFVAVLKACATARDLYSGKDVHADILECGNKPDMFVQNCLVHMYAKCGSLEDACKVFDTLATKDVVTWTAMIAAYAQYGLGHEALALYERMQQEGITSADAVTYVCLLHACGSVTAFEKGKQIHTRIKETGLQDTHLSVVNALIDMYAKCGSLVDAHKVFKDLRTRDVVTWNALIAGYAQHGFTLEAFALYADMRQQGVTSPNHVTFICLLQACVMAKALDKGKEIHSQIREQRFESDLVVGNCLVSMYAKCGSLDDARKVFEALPDKDIVTWNAMIAGYAQHGLGQEALALYGSMPREIVTAADSLTFVSLLQACGSVAALEKGKEIHAQLSRVGLEATDSFVGNALIDMYSKCKSLEDARRVFDILPIKDVVTWNAMITGYAQQGRGQEALALYENMEKETITPANHVTFVCLLQACASVGSLHQGLQLHSQIQSRGLESDGVVGTCLVDMYAKCGSVENARSVFNNLPRKHVVTWNVMIAGYAQHGLGQEALTLYASMQWEGITPADAITFVCLLEACSSVAGLEKGKEIHAEISRAGLLATNLFVANALVHMYGKCGSMVDAQQVFHDMSRRDIVTWSSLIAGYARQGESGVVFELFETMRHEGLQPDGVTFLSVLSVCSHVGEVEQGQKYFDIMIRDYDITPTVEHYNCIVDLLGRAGQLGKAMQMVKTMPYQPNGQVWRSLLGACRKWKSVELGREAFESAVSVDRTDPAVYVLMSNIYAAAHMEEEAKEIKAMRLKAQAWKNPGQSWWTDTGGIVHTFLVGDTEHPDSQHVYERLGELLLKLSDLGYAPYMDALLEDM